MLLSVSLIVGMLIAWLAVTLVFILLCIYRAMLSLREEDVLYIDPGEEKLLQQQRLLNEKIERLRPFLIASGTLMVVVGLATFGLWVYRQLT